MAAAIIKDVMYVTICAQWMQDIYRVVQCTV